MAGWEPDAIEAMRKLYVDDGMSASQTAKVFNREFASKFGKTVTRNAVIGVLHRAGHTRGEVSKPKPAPRYTRPASRPSTTRKITTFNPPNPRKGFTPQPPPEAGPVMRHAPIPSSDPPGPEARILLELGPRCCKAPVGPDPGETRMDLQLFCGRPAVEGRSYCPGHRRLSHKAPDAKSKRRAAHGGA